MTGVPERTPEAERGGHVVARADAHDHAGRQAELAGRGVPDDARGLVGRQHPRQHGRIEVHQRRGQDPGVVGTRRGRPPARPRRITPVGHRVARQPLGQVVMGQPDALRRRRHAGFDLAQPRPAGDGEGGDRHRARRAPPTPRGRASPRGARSGARSGCRSRAPPAAGAAPAASRTTRPCCCAPMLMAAMSRARPVAARASRSASHQPLRVALAGAAGARDLVGRTPASHLDTGVSVDDHDRRRLGGAIDARDEPSPCGHLLRPAGFIDERGRRAVGWATEAAGSAVPGPGLPRQHRTPPRSGQPVGDVRQVVRPDPRLATCSSGLGAAGCPHRSTGRARWGRC